MRSRQTIQQYLIGETIGIGFSSKVKIAESENTGQRLAMKIVKHNASLQQQLRREVAIMRLLRHPHLLSFVDAFADDRASYIVTEYASNGALFDYLVSSGPLHPSAAMAVFRQIVYGVHFLHVHCVAHGNLKLENIVLDEHDVVKITGLGFVDFGNVALPDSCSGSAQYAAPELLTGTWKDRRNADIWSCGVILYAMLTGRMPFEDVSTKRLRQKIVSGEYPVLEGPEMIGDLIARMLEVDEDKRIECEGIIDHAGFRGGLPDGYEPPKPFMIIDLKKRLALAEEKGECSIESWVVDELPWPLRDEESSLEAVFSDGGGGSMEQTLRIEGAAQDGEAIMRELQLLLPKIGFDWLHPTEFTLISRRPSDGLSMAFELEIVEWGTVEMRVTLLQGSAVGFDFIFIEFGRAMNMIGRKVIW